MHLFASHFGTYEVAQGPDGAELRPFRHDPTPSPVGMHFLDLARHPTRVLQPMARTGWLAGDGGKGRGRDEFVPLNQDEAAGLAATALTDVLARHGNEAIFGGSYGWGSAGRFHHPQSQLKRFLNLAGGFVSAVNTYSYGTAKVLWPHIVGAPYSDPGAFNPTWDRIVSGRPFILSFGGMRLANAQVEAGGTGQHRTRGWLERFRAARGEMLTISPDRRDAPFGEHHPIRAGTDAHAMLALAFAILEEGLSDENFLDAYTEGWPRVAALLRGELDGVPKTPEWAEGETGIPAATLRDIARKVASGPTLINLAWSLQRAVRGEQPYWAAAVLAAMTGQFGKEGAGIACGLSAVSSVGNPVCRMRGPAFDQGENPVRAFIPVARITEMLERPDQTIPYNGGEITLPDIRLIWWAGGNPFHHHQDLNRLVRAWRRPETVIVHESVWTATARHADLVFPSALPFERNDVAAAGRDDWIVFSRQVREAPVGIVTDHACLTAIAHHLGFANQFTEGLSEMDWLQRIYAGYRDTFPELPGWDEFIDLGAVKLREPERHELPQPLEDFLAAPQARPLKTPSGRIELAPQLMWMPDARTGRPLCIPLAADAEEEVESYPLRLLSPQPEQRLHSQLDGARAARLARVSGLEVARLHPHDLRAAGVRDSAVADLYNKRGRVRIVAQSDDAVSPGHVVLPTGGWYTPQTDGQTGIVDLGGNPNVLTRDVGASALSQGASAGGTRVAISPVGGVMRD